MAAVGLQGRSSASWAERNFYLIMAVVMAVVILAGFSRTAPAAIMTPPGLPLLLHVHGFIFLLWLMLFIAQPALVSRGSIALHRRLGWFGAGLAGLMVILAWAATLFALWTHNVPPFFPPGFFLAMNMLDGLFFGGLVTAAILKRREGDWHKRLMLCATALLLGPGLGRLLPMPAFGAAAPLVMAVVQDLILTAGPAFDLATRRRIHPAYFWGGGAVVVVQILTGPIGMSPPVLAAATRLAAHGG